MNNYDTIDKIILMAIVVNVALVSVTGISWTIINLIK